MEGLADESRSGIPRGISDEKVEEAVTRTPEGMPTAAAQWSTRSPAQNVGHRQSAAVRIWRSSGLHRGRVSEASAPCRGSLRGLKIAGADSSENGARLQVSVSRRVKSPVPGNMGPPNARGHRPHVVRGFHRYSWAKGP
jgi:hypothetical protein